VALYQISYDLREQRNYEVIFERIEAYGAWCHALDCGWLVSTEQSAEEIRNDLLQVVDDDDSLLVTRLSGEAAWYGFVPSVSKWLKTQLENAAA
jgi:hypothetical protein